MADRGTGLSLNELEHSWFATRSGLPANAPTSQHKRAYLISQLTFAAAEDPKRTRLLELEKRWLRALTSSTSDELSTLWRLAAAGQAGADAGFDVDENKRLYYRIVAS